MRVNNGLDFSEHFQAEETEATEVVDGKLVDKYLIPKIKLW